MINVELIQATLEQSCLTVMDLHKGNGSHGASAMKQIQETVWGKDFDDKRSTKLNLGDFDSFGFAWDRLPKDERFMLISAAYRQNRELFSTVKMSSCIKWEFFSQPQKVVLEMVCKDLLQISGTLFSDKSFSEGFVKEFVNARKNDKARLAS